MCLLAQRLTGSLASGIVAGTIFAFVTFRFDHFMHLELQATILRRKYFEKICGCLPRTCGRLGHKLTDSCFQEVTRHWKGEASPLSGLLRMIELAAKLAPHAVSRSEVNRVRFAAGRKRFALKFPPDLFVSGHERRALQLLFRRLDGTWMEWALFWSLPGTWHRSTRKIGSQYFSDRTN